MCIMVRIISEFVDFDQDYFRIFSSWSGFFQNLLIMVKIFSHFFFIMIRSITKSVDAGEDFFQNLFIVIRIFSEFVDADLFLTMIILPLRLYTIPSQIVELPRISRTK